MKISKRSEEDYGECGEDYGEEKRVEERLTMKVITRKVAKMEQ